VSDFSLIAQRYDDLRPAGRGWQELADRTLERLAGATRLLDLGCGTGRFTVLAAERLGSLTWGVDSSPEMLAEARARRPGGRGIGWKLGDARALPFKDGWFDAAHLHLVLHLIDDRAQALGELRRVLAAGGRLVIVTFRPEHFTSFHLNRYFPSIPAIDGARFADPELIVAELAALGFTAAGAEPFTQRVSVEPSDLLERARGRYISTLQHLPPDEYAQGLEQLARDVEAGQAPTETVLEWSLVSAVRG
jgi:ubiquinone/menaquinone biosynthesis C-methylase UbiE